MAPNADQELIARFLAGESLSFDALIRRHKSRIFSAILLIVRDRVAAEDVLQDTLLKIYAIMRDGKYKEEGKFLPWALRIAKNMAIDYFRREKRSPEVRSDMLNESAWKTTETIEHIVCRREDKQNVRHLISLLPRAQREVLIMRHYQDMSFKEIAGVTNVSINTALGRMRYALLNLRRLADEHHISA